MKLAFYGDDFTGSTDALEVLAFAGLNCALFLDVPDEQTLREFGPFDAIGVAGELLEGKVRGRVVVDVAR